MQRLAFDFVQELCGYWFDFPPPHLLLRGFVGYNPAKKAESDGKAELEFLNMAARGGVKKFKKLPASVQDFIREVRDGKHRTD